MESDQSILNDLEPKLGTELKEALQCELAEVSEVLQKLLECDRLGIRLATLRGPMCPKFHVDQVPCRMLMTISGRGTEWIANPEVDPVLMADRHNQEPPLRTGGEVRHIGSGEWSLLKGGTWEEQFNGVVHRSPHGQGQRLFMSIDPVFSDAA